MGEGTLQLRRLAQEGGSLVQLTGTIDEHLAQTPIGDVGPLAVFDFEGVRRITSFGVREWMNALQGLNASYYAFINCHPSIISQFNMVGGFAVAGVLVSFYAPYVCESCGVEIEHKLDLRNDYAVVSSFTPPKVMCPKCGTEAEFDDIPDAYFAYAASRPPPFVPPLAQRLIDGDETRVEAPIRIEKEVRGNVTGLKLSGPLDKRARFKRLIDGLEGQVIVIASEVTSVDDDGIHALLQLTSSPGYHTSVVKTPAFLLRALAAKRDAFSNSDVVSAILPLACSHCNEEHLVEVNAAMVKNDDSTLAAILCSHCGHPNDKSHLGEELLGVAASVLVEPSHDDVRQYVGSAFQTKAETTTATSSTSLQERGPEYDIIRRIGAGGMAEVFLANQKRAGGFQKTVVLKRLLPNLTEDPAFMKMFVEEARLAARISHANVVQIFDLGKFDGQYCIAMEYIDGFNLREVLGFVARQKTSIPIEIACRITSDICAGLHAAHTCTDDEGKPLGIVHRDVSPANVLMSHDGAVKIADFGIAKAALGTQASTTRPGELKGKVLYVAPEQLLHPEISADSRSDIFSTGIVLYECLTGVHPFRKHSEYASLSAIANDDVTPAASRRPDVGATLGAIVAKALAKDPKDRYQSAGDFHHALESLISSTGQSVTAARVAAWLKTIDTSSSRSPGLDAGPSAAHESEPATPAVARAEPTPARAEPTPARAEPTPARAEPTPAKPEASRREPPAPGSRPEPPRREPPAPGSRPSFDSLEDVRKKMGEARSRLDRLISQRKPKD